MAGVYAFGNANSTIEAGTSFNHISTATTTLVKSGSGILCDVNINSKGTVASTVTIYDSLTASGTVIAVLDSLNLAGTFHFNCLVTIGITVVTIGTVAPDVTVTFR